MRNPKIENPTRVEVSESPDFLGFFDSVLKSNAPIKVKRAVANEKQSPNILYLTSECNMDCSYCYQKAERESNRFNATKAYVTNFIDSVIRREPNRVSTIVLFGGEPFLKYDLMKFAIQTMAQKDHKFAISTTTNGTLLTPEKYEELKSLVSKKDSFSLEISYDGTGNHRRTQDSLEHSEHLLGILKALPKHEISIRYTIHGSNFACAFEDITKLCLKGYKKIIVNFYEFELQSYVDVPGFKQTLINKTEYLFERLKTPICHLNCRVCLGCNYKEFEGINYGDFEVRGNAQEFNHFSKLGNK